MNNNNNNNNNINNNNYNSLAFLMHHMLADFWTLELIKIAKQIPNFDISNVELTKIFTNSWRNSSLEYTDEFVILANKLGLN
ncbi:1080_t:CDS:2 [Entrophospora sp. SA101]|nr:1080_t:CDS:2 [Entrophospora sp. SA101]